MSINGIQSSLSKKRGEIMVRSALFAETESPLEEYILLHFGYDEDMKVSPVAVRYLNTIHHALEQR